MACNISHPTGTLGMKLPQDSTGKHAGVDNEAQTSIQKFQSRAREQLFWIGMSIDKLSECEICNQYKNSNPKEPLLQMEVPDIKQSRISLDFF